MKTPWKFLSQIVSRRPPAKAPESSHGDDADFEAIESEAEQRSAPPLSSTVPPSRPAQDEDVSVDQGVVASDKAKGDDDVAQALKPPNLLVPKSAASTKSQSEPRIKRRERGKMANAHVAAQSAVTPKRRQRLQPSSSRDLFFHEVTTIEEEIKRLRAQLAQKLHLQNVQLKKMLERFDVS